MFCSRPAGCGPHHSGQDQSVIENLVRFAFRLFTKMIKYDFLSFVFFYFILTNQYP